MSSRAKQLKEVRTADAPAAAAATGAAPPAAAAAAAAPTKMKFTSDGPTAQPAIAGGDELKIRRIKVPLANSNNNNAFGYRLTNHGDYGISPKLSSFGAKWKQEIIFTQDSVENNSNTVFEFKEEEEPAPAGGITNTSPIPDGTHCLVPKQGEAPNANNGQAFEIELAVAQVSAPSFFFTVDVHCFTPEALRLMQKFIQPVQAQSPAPTASRTHNGKEAILEAVWQYLSHRRRIMKKLGYTADETKKDELTFSTSNSNSAAEHSIFDIPCTNPSYSFSDKAGSGTNSVSGTQRRFYESDGYTAFTKHRDRGGAYQIFLCGGDVDITIDVVITIDTF